MTAEFSPENMVARRKWHNIFQVLKAKNCRPQILYLLKISFRNEGEIKTFSDKEKRGDFVASKPILLESSLDMKDITEEASEL